MARDFSAKVTAFLAQCSPLPVRAAGPAPTPPPFSEQAETLRKASAGDVDAQVMLAVRFDQASQSSPELDLDLMDSAEDWARRAVAGGSTEGRYLLAMILIHRAAVALGADLMGPAERLAVEGLSLLDGLADEGVEEAAQAIVAATAALAQHGLNLGAATG